MTEQELATLPVPGSVMAKFRGMSSASAFSFLMIWCRVQGTLRRAHEVCLILHSSAVVLIAVSGLLFHVSAPRLPAGMGCGIASGAAAIQCVRCLRSRRFIAQRQV